MSYILINEEMFPYQLQISILATALELQKIKKRFNQKQGYLIEHN